MDGDADFIYKGNKHNTQKMEKRALVCVCVCACVCSFGYINTLKSQSYRGYIHVIHNVHRRHANRRSARRTVQGRCAEWKIMQQ